MKTLEKNKASQLHIKHVPLKALKEKKMHESWYAVRGMIDDKRAKEFHAHIKELRNEWR